jgi:tetratricopeptide (TPR) repeat protein
MMPVPDSAFALGLLRAQQGRWPEAIAALQRCVDEQPDYPRARYNLALAYAKSGDTTRALDELERAAALEDTHREAVLTLIDLARQRTTSSGSSAGCSKPRSSIPTCARIPSCGTSSSR